MQQFFAILRSSFVLLVIMTVVLGGVYPLMVTAVAQALFSYRANGSLIERGDNIVGSSLIGQHFEHPKYFWGRLSATTPPYNAAASSGSNMSPANPKLLVVANARIAELQKSSPGAKKPVPIDLISASASGLDPHISLASAQYQLSRVARARGMKDAELQALVEKHTETPLLGLGGDAYVNVVRLNLALDDMAGQPRKEKR